MRELWTRLVIRLTARRWNSLIASTLLQCHEVGLINSHQLHALAHEFDPTQAGGRVARIIAGGPDARFSDALLKHSRASKVQSRAVEEEDAATTGGG